MEEQQEPVSGNRPSSGSQAPSGNPPESGSPAGADRAAAAEPAGEPSLRYNSRREVAKSGLLGAFIGLAIIVPGVSGSAVAIIFRLYEKLLWALGNVVRRFRVCARFLLPIVIGGVAGLAVGFFGVRALLSLLPFAVVALFAGLMLGAFPSVTDQLKGERPTPVRVALLAVGFAFPVAISLFSVYGSFGAASLEELQAWHYPVFVLLGFAVTITQLVPGLSATALLMTVGYFAPLMNSVSLTYWRSNPQVLLVYLCLVVGFVAGLPIVSRLLSRLLSRRRAPTFYTVAGLSLGSVATMFFNSDRLELYRGWTPGAAMWWDLGIGLVLFAGGVVVAYLFVRYERRHPTAEPDKQ